MERRPSNRAAFSFVAVLLLVLAAPIVAQEPTRTIIRPSGPDETTVELPKSGPPPEPEYADGEQVAVIPAGQEHLLAEMLGKDATLAGCTLSGGNANGAQVEATYRCPAGDVVVVLGHPTQAAAGATKTESFAISLKSGSAPAELLPEIATRVRARETGFQWVWLGQPRRVGPAVSRPFVLLAAGGILLVTIVLAVWALRARRS